MCGAESQSRQSTGLGSPSLQKGNKLLILSNVISIHRDCDRFTDLSDMARELRIVFTERVPLASAEWCPGQDELEEMLENTPAQMLLESFRRLSKRLEKERRQKGHSYQPEEQQIIWLEELGKERAAFKP